MKNSRIQFEPSLATKKLHLATRKAPRILGGRIHPGLVHTASPVRDVTLTCLAFALEAASLTLLYWKLPFHLGIVAGLAAFDTAGALLMHAGVADENHRRARIAVAETTEEAAAIAAQRPAYFKYVRALGAACILGPLIFKAGSILWLPMALKVLGAFAAALLVSFTTIAMIHLFVTGYGLAQLRYGRAEKRERMRMLRSAILPDGRKEHENRIKATRTHRFSTYAPLKDVAHSDGHSLRVERNASDGRNSYVLTTRGRFDDQDLDFMVNGQHDLNEKAELCLRGLQHQLHIEQSEPLPCSEVLPAESRPVIETTPAPGPAPQPGPRATVMAMTAMLAFVLTGCGPEKAEPVKMKIVATKALTVANSHLPETVLALLTPPEPFAGKFVPRGEIVRLDLNEGNAESLEPVSKESALQAGLSGVWQMESAELELAKSTALLRERSAGIAAKPAPALEPAETTRRLAAFIAGARSDGSEILAVSKAAKDGFVTIAPGVSVEARNGPKEAVTLIEEKLKGGAQPNMVVLLDPPVFRETAPEKPNAENVKSDELRIPRSESHAESTSGGSDTFIVNVLPGTTPPKVELRLPPNAKPMGEPVRFESNSSKLTAQGREAVESIASAMKESGRQRVILVASSDPVGTEKFNDDLARRRGDAVSAALVNKGICVQSVLSVGESFAPDATPRSERQHFREVRAYTTEEISAVKP